MGTEPPKPLVEGDTVQLDIGDASGVLSCSVLGFVGPAILVLPQSSLSPAARDSLRDGVPAVDLLVDAGDYLHAVRGTAKAAGEAIAVRLTEKTKIGQRRWYSRADVALKARLVPQGGDLEPTETATMDISSGGVQVHRPAGMPIWPRYEVTLSGETLATPIVAEAVPARVQDESLGLRFTRIDAHDREILTGLVMQKLTERAT